MRLFRPMLIGTLGLSAAMFSVAAQVPGSRIPTPNRHRHQPTRFCRRISAHWKIENAVAQGITVGAAGSYIDVSDSRFTTLEFKLRYYPGDVVLRGWSVGATAGSTRFSNIVDGNRETLVAPTLGLIVDYNWLLGRSEHFLIGTGLGAKRVLASEDAHVSARTSIGQYLRRD